MFAASMCFRESTVDTWIKYVHLALACLEIAVYRPRHREKETAAVVRTTYGTHQPFLGVCALTFEESLVQVGTLTTICDGCGNNLRRIVCR